MTSNIPNANAICRVCMSTNGSFINIFFKLETNFSIVNTLTECAPVEINAEDGLPPQICINCLQKLEIYLNLKNQIIQSDATFRQNLQNNTDVKPQINSNGEITNFPFQEFVSVNTTNHVDISEVVIKEENFSDENTVEENTEKNPSDDVSCEENNSKEQTKNIKKKTRKIKPAKNVDSQANESASDFITEDEHLLDGIGSACKAENTGQPEKKKRRRQKKTENQKPKNIFKCDKCEKSYDAKYRLEYHQRRHTGVKPFLCDLCGKSFSWNSDFQMHQKQHNNDFSYQCEFCSKRFVRLNEFKEHHRTHLDERTFKCNVCDKAFKQHSSLRAHKKIHTGIKNFQCEVCEKRFLSKYVLIKHKRMHTGERPYECTMCNKTFPQDAGLFKHNKIVHNISSIKSSNVRIVKTDIKSETVALTMTKNGTE